jgi:ABC transport system ATP-binding/permease protein
MIINASELAVRYNDQVVLDKATLALCEGDRVGLVGRNGCGKSTFLKILAGELAPDSGTVSRRRELVLGYLPQAFELDHTLNVQDNIRQGATHVLELIRQFEALPADSTRHAELEQRILALDGWNLDLRIQTAMSHLNAPAGSRQIDSLSGGEKRRVALCRAIVSRPDLLILDEPTNHLDPESIDWVADFLRSYPGSFLMVTHDRNFLDTVTNRMVELANGVFYSYDGNYTDYLLAKAERQATEELVERKRQSFLRRELDWVRRGPQARTTKSKSRLDRYYEIEGQKPPEQELDVELVIPPPPPLANRVLELAEVGMTLGERTLFRGLSFQFAAGMKIGVVGRNGVGKTTLLRLIMSEMPPTEGVVRLGGLTKINYVDQSRLQLHDEKSVFDEASDGTEYVIFGDDKLSLRGYLKRFLFTDDRINTQVKNLSGGERSRLLLARILKNGGNFLILDEPTNDLDLPTLRVLEEALINYPGCVLVVSHDRYFLDRVCTGMLVFNETNQTVVYNVGNYSDYLERVRRETAAASQPASTDETARKSVDDSPAAKTRKLTWNEERELEGMEGKILAAETEIARLEALFARPDFHREYGAKIKEINDELAAAKAQLTAHFARWEELEGIRHAFLAAKNGQRG